MAIRAETEVAIMDRETNGKAGRPARTARLWRVLVLGGAVIAAACGAGSKDRGGEAKAAQGSAQKDSKPGESSQQAGESGGEDAGGVPGW
jgi:hypothetical protein